MATTKRGAGDPPAPHRHHEPERCGCGHRAIDHGPYTGRCYGIAIEPGLNDVVLDQGGVAFGLGLPRCPCLAFVADGAAAPKSPSTTESRPEETAPRFERPGERRAGAGR